MKTREEIIHALGNCQKDPDRTLICDNCPYCWYKTTSTCMSRLHADVIELLAKDNKSYEDGVKKAWNTLKSVWLENEGRGMADSEVKDCFDYISKEDVLIYMDPLKAIKLYEEYKEKLEVGMIVENEVGVKVVVLRINGDFFDGFSKDGPYSGCLIKQWKKTGETINVESFFEKLQ